MGFESIAAQAIMFIAVLGASALLVMTFHSQLTDTTNSLSTRQYALSQQIRTEIVIESISYNASSSQVVAYVKNTGKTLIKPDEVSVYIDNAWVANTSRTVTILTDTNTYNPTIWDPKEVIKVIVTQSVESNIVHKFKVNTPYTANAEAEFSV